MIAEMAVAGGGRDDSFCRRNRVRTTFTAAAATIASRGPESLPALTTRRISQAYQIIQEARPFRPRLAFLLTLSCYTAAVLTWSGVRYSHNWQVNTAQLDVEEHGTAMRSGTRHCYA